MRKLLNFHKKLAEVVAQSVIDQKLNKEPIADAKQAVADMKWVPEYRAISK
ncbi:Malolactic enzyme [Lactiplantibacillus plantarum]|uniref:Malolactic enzyme n=1 Tax=Lactiplantibacillus plantarum TaxID=1590 RepID=A0AAW3RJ23_LACPN|nr:Malolactic enzyme [Lactiplantibacillus plantarum]